MDLIGVASDFGGGGEGEVGEGGRYVAVGYYDIASHAGAGAIRASLRGL